MWQHGTSTVAALSAGRRFNVVALATILVAVIPLNGLILQNAVGTKLQAESRAVTVSMPVATSVPLGWSGILSTQNGGVEYLNWDISYLLGQAFIGQINTLRSLDHVSGCDLNTTCLARMPSVGFSATCNRTTLPFNLPLDSEAADLTVDETVFSSKLDWSTTIPNEMRLRTQWKPFNAPECQGSLEVRDCSLQLAYINQPVEVKPTTLGRVAEYATGLDAQQQVYDYRLAPSSAWQNDTLIKPFPVFDEENTFNTTIGALAKTLAQFFDGTVNISYALGEAHIRSTGLYASLSGASGGLYDPSLGAATDSTINKCNTTFGKGESTDFGDEIVNSIRSLVFYTISSEFNHGEGEGAIPPVAFPAVQSQVFSIYSVLWAYWGASLAITLVIVLAVTPIFWGFWMLRQKATMSPMETARAFR